MNIVIIVIESFRPKNLSLFGYEKLTDKCLRKIADESLFFQNFYSSSNCTLASLTSLFTGVSPESSIKHWNFETLTKEEEENFEKIKFWLPSYLKQKGYETYGLDWLGQWLKKGFDYYEEGKESLIRKILNKIRKRKLIFPTAEETINTAIKKIKQSKNQYFLFMHLYETHFPFPMTKYKDSGNDDNLISRAKTEEQKQFIKKRLELINLKAMDDIVNKYEKAIKEIDSQIWRFYNFIDKENTILIILGDHGLCLNEPENLLGYTGLNKELFHTLLLMKFPNTPPKVINKRFQNMDIAPTIVDYLENKSVNLKERENLVMVDGFNFKEEK